MYRMRFSQKSQAVEGFDSSSLIVPLPHQIKLSDLMVPREKVGFIRGPWMAGSPPQSPWDV